MIEDTMATWHRVAKNHDVEGLYQLIDEAAVFYSPVVHSPQFGKAAVGQYLSAALLIFFNDSFNYVRELHGEGQAILEFEVEIESIKVNGVDMIRWNNAGLITEFKVMLRPLKAVNLIHEQMGAMLMAQTPRTIK